MKAKHLITSLLFTIFCLTLSTASYAQTVSAKKSNEAEVTFVTNLTCPNCQKKVEAKLPFERGVKDLKIDLEKNEIWILFQTDRTDKTKLAEAIVKLGYSATEKGSASSGNM